MPTGNKGRLRNALLWDDTTLPTGTGWLTASWLLVLLVAMLSSTALRVAAYLLAATGAGSDPTNWRLPEAPGGLWLIVRVGLVSLVVQVVVLRAYLWWETKKIRFENKRKALVEAERGEGRGRQAGNIH